VPEPTTFTTTDADLTSLLIAEDVARIVAVRPPSEGAPLVVFELAATAPAACDAMRASYAAGTQNVALGPFLRVQMRVRSLIHSSRLSSGVGGR
jgi:hypothetical protein